MDRKNSNWEKEIFCGSNGFLRTELKNFVWPYAEELYDSYNPSVSPTDGNLIYTEKMGGKILL